MVPQNFFLLEKSTPKNGTSRTFIYGSYPPPGTYPVHSFKDTGFQKSGIFPDSFNAHPVDGVLQLQTPSECPSRQIVFQCIAFAEEELYVYAEEICTSACCASSSVVANSFIR